MTLKEIYDGIKEVSPSICKNMEGTCDECPFGIWIEPDGYNCGFYLFQEQIENYAEIEETVSFHSNYKIAHRLFLTDIRKAFIDAEYISIDRNKIVAKNDKLTYICFIGD